MESEVAEEPRVHQPVSVVTLLAVALLVFAVGVGAWVVWQLSAGSRPPAAFEDRTALPQCPPITVPQGQSTPVLLQDCLFSPDAQRDGVEVVVTSLSTEGSPTKTYYRVLPGGGAEMFSDVTADAYGPGGWTHVQCPDAAALETRDGCRPA